MSEDFSEEGDKAIMEKAKELSQEVAKHEARCQQYMNMLCHAVNAAKELVHLDEIHREVAFSLPNPALAIRYCQLVLAVDNLMALDSITGCLIPRQLVQENPLLAKYEESLDIEVDGEVQEDFDLTLLDLETITKMLYPDPKAAVNTPMGVTRKYLPNSMMWNYFHCEQHVGNMECLMVRARKLAALSEIPYFLEMKHTFPSLFNLQNLRKAKRCPTSIHRQFIDQGHLRHRLNVEVVVKQEPGADPATGQPQPSEAKAKSPPVNPTAKTKGNRGDRDPRQKQPTIDPPSAKRKKTETPPHQNRPVRNLHRENFASLDRLQNSHHKQTETLQNVLTDVQGMEKSVRALTSSMKEMPTKADLDHGNRLVKTRVQQAQDEQEEKYSSLGRRLSAIETKLEDIFMMLKSQRNRATLESLQEDLKVGHQPTYDDGPTYRPAGGPHGPNHGGRMGPPNRPMGPAQDMEDTWNLNRGQPSKNPGYRTA